ncbi:MAG: hydroxyacid dehydrogenase, partial [Clostridia bacterium]|nr:hydroxyacid dehydrogenase [Clostridia bacterium]
EANGLTVDGEILAPFFKEGGRFTIGNVHYVRQGDELVPAAQTEFAKDRTFGYTKSSIPAYIEEKTNGAYQAADVTCITLDSLRAMDFDGIEAQLLAVKDFGRVCLNAVDYCDLKVFCVALYRAMAKGKRFLFRTAAGLVKVMGGISDRPLLTRRDMVTKETVFGGVVVVGSHTQKTTAQLNELLKLDCVVPVEFDSNRVLDGDDAFYAEVDRCARAEEEIIRSGRTAVCYTCRKLLTLEGDTKESALLRSVKISDGVQSLVARLGVTPAFVIAKGGITSSDVGTKALAVKRANVMGQIRPCIPVWQTGAESRFPQTPYVIFPGNTGSETTLREAVEVLTDKG